MKGIVFTEFLEMVEAQYSPAFLEDLIDEVQLSSGGAYTSVGTYPHRKLVSLAKLPSFQIEVNNSKHFSMVYKAERPFGDLCKGLIIGCLRHFGDAAGLRRENLQTEPVTRIRFKIFKARA